MVRRIDHSAPKRAVGYVRVSDVRGRSGETFLSDKLQRERIEAWARYREHPVVSWYVDLDRSARTGKARPEFERMMADARSGAFEIVAVYRVTRFARSMRDAATRYAELLDLGIDFVSVTEDIDTLAAGGRFMLNVMFAMAEFESERIGEEWRAVHANRRRRGLAQATRGVFGYRVEGSVPVAVEPAEARAVRHLFHERAGGSSISDLQRWLHEQGYRPSRGGERFPVSTLGRMLRNPIYAGLVRAGDELVEAQHEPIVSRELFEHVQTLWTHTTQLNRFGRGHGSGLVSGVVVCSGCGYKMTAWRSQGYTFYRCPAYQQSRECPHPTTIRQEKLDRYVERELLARVDPKQLPNRGKVSSRRDAWARREQQLAKRVADLNRSLDRLSDERYLLGSLSEGEYARQVERLLRERSSTEAQLEETRQLAARKRPASIDWLDAWPLLPRARQQAIVRRLVNRIEIKPGRRGNPQPPLSSRVAIDWL